MDKDMDMSRTQMDIQEEIDLFEDGDGTHHSTLRPNQSNEEAADSKYTTGAPRDWKTQRYKQGLMFFSSCNHIIRDDTNYYFYFD